jgi:Zn-finger nucleic acid-binding protein
MVTLELKRIEIDCCTECGGTWLDAGELEQLLEDSEDSRKLLASFEPQPVSKEKACRCPICSKKMEKVKAGREGSGAILDRCPYGDGIWFDRGELDDIIADLDPESDIRKLLIEVFPRPA